MFLFIYSVSIYILNRDLSYSSNIITRNKNISIFLYVNSDLMERHYPSFFSRDIFLLLFFPILTSPHGSLDQIQRSVRSYSILVAKEISHDLRRGFESGWLQLVIPLVFSKIIVSGVSLWLRDNARSFKITIEFNVVFLSSSYEFDH